MCNPLLALTNVHYHIGPKSIISDVNLEMYSGNTMSIIGPNGAGKSMLLNLINGALLPSHGTIKYLGKNINDLNKIKFRRKLAIVYQDSLLLNATVRENIGLGLKLRGERRRYLNERVEYWANQYHITHLLNRNSRTLSGGEAQRVSLARACSINPELLLLDEPFAALDAPTKLEVMADLQEIIQNNQMTSIMVTHDFDEAVSLGERLAIMMDGTIMQLGAPSEVFSDPVNERIAAFVGYETIIPGYVKEVTGEHLVIESRDNLIEAVGNVVVGSKVLACLRPEDIVLYKSDDMPMTSARNRINGEVTRIFASGQLIKVTILHDNIRLIASITKKSLVNLDINLQDRITATFKASAVHLIKV